MTEYRIAVLVGSLRRDSLNRGLANATIKLGPPEFSFDVIRIEDLPPYNQDDEKTPADSVTRLKKEVSAAQGLMFVTPEYNRSIPGVLKNAIDQGSRPYGQSRVARQTGGHHGRVARRGRHLDGAATPAQRSRAPGRSDDGPAGSVLSGARRDVRRRGQSGQR